MVLISFIFLLPYVFSMLWSGRADIEQKEELQQSKQEDIVLCLEDERGKLTLTMEEYLCGCLPFVIPVQYEKECLRAQAVLLRTQVIGAFFRQVTEGNQELILEADTYLSPDQLEEMWGENYTEYQEKIRQAVSSTNGIYLTFEGLPIEACFFRVSAGRTRTAGSFLGQGYEYLAAVDCPKDYLSKDYLTQAKYSRTKLERLLGGTIAQLSYDDSGYVDWVTVVSLDSGESREYTGEWLRKKLKLPSAHITMKEQGDKIFFQVKGAGHGFGMSQFAANEMAAQGADYQTILSYFFQNITFDKYLQP